MTNKQDIYIPNNMIVHGTTETDKDGNEYTVLTDIALYINVDNNPKAQAQAFDIIRAVNYVLFKHSTKH